MTGDTGANFLQNFPVLATASISGANITTDGSFNSLANGYYRIEFFANSPAVGGDNGTGQTFLGFANITTDASGNATLNSTFSASVISISTERRCWGASRPVFKRSVNGIRSSWMSSR